MKHFWIFLLIFISAKSDSNEEGGESTFISISKFSPNSNVSTKEEPILSIKTPTNLTIQSGTEYILLNCPISPNYANYSVSWLRLDQKGSLKLLTFDGVIYSSKGPSKYVLILSPFNAQLKIKIPTISDNGEYLCQISSHPPKVLRYNIHIVAPTVEIVDDGDKPLTDKIFKMDSTLELRCRVFVCCFSTDHSGNLPEHVSWFHDNRLLNNDTFRGGISVKSEMKRNEFSVSKLYIANMNRNDSGFYTCSMPKFGKATVLVTVLKGEIPAAMQVNGEKNHLIPNLLFNSILMTLSLLFV